MFDIYYLLAVDCGAFDVNMKVTNIAYESVGCGVFSSRQLGVEKIVESYFGTSVHSNLTTQKQVRKTYDDSVMFVSGKIFLHGRSMF